MWHGFITAVSQIIRQEEEGSEKKRRQIELDYQREIDEIRKQRKKWEDAQGGKLTSEQRDVLGNRASNAMQSREKGLAEITETENQAAIEANERYLKSYGTFMQGVLMRFFLLIFHQRRSVKNLCILEYADCFWSRRHVGSF